MLGVWQAYHAEPDKQPGQAREDGYEERHLEGEVQSYLARIRSA